MNKRFNLNIPRCPCASCFAGMVGEDYEVAQDIQYTIVENFQSFPQESPLEPLLEGAHDEMAGRMAD
jgi:hypothetical protein